MKIYTNDLVKGHSDFKVKCLTFGLYTQVSDSGPLGPLVFLLTVRQRRRPKRLKRASLTSRGSMLLYNVQIVYYRAFQ